MRLKTYTAQTASEAMAQAREALGDDAIIISTRDEDDGQVTITVALEDADESPLWPEARPAASVRARPPAAAAQMAPPVGRMAAHTAPGRGNAAARVRVPQGDPRPQRSPRATEDKAKTRSAGPVRRAPVVDPSDAIYDAMRFHRVPAVIGEDLMSRVVPSAREPVDSLAVVLAEMFDFRPLEVLNVRQPPYVLVGPPGAGKTRTATKLAARGVLSGLSTALATIDIERTGALEQLRAFAHPLHISVLTAGSPTILGEVLLSTADHGLVVIDTGGRNHLDAEDMADLVRFLVNVDVEPVLVLPAGIDHMEAADIADAFAELGVQRMVATRIDITRRLGSILSGAYAATLALAELSATPMIKDGLVPASADWLARRLLPSAPSAAALRTGTER